MISGKGTPNLSLTKVEWRPCFLALSESPIRARSELQLSKIVLLDQNLAFQTRSWL